MRPITFHRILYYFFMVVVAANILWLFWDIWDILGNERTQLVFFSIPPERWYVVVGIDLIAILLNLWMMNRHRNIVQSLKWRQ